MRTVRWGLIFALTGCAVSQPLSRPATLILKPQIAAGWYSNVVVPNYVRDNIHHIDIRLFTVNGETEQDTGITRTLTSAQFDNPIVFNNLTEQTHIRVRASAYSSEDDSVSITNDASSSTDIVLAYDDRPTVAPLLVTLVDKPFGAEAVDSAVIYHRFLPTGSESVQVN